MIPSLDFNYKPTIRASVDLSELEAAKPHGEWRHTRNLQLMTLRVILSPVTDEEEQVGHQTDSERVNQSLQQVAGPRGSCL